jgi:hypothetical protein
MPKMAVGVHFLGSFYCFFLQAGIELQVSSYCLLLYGIKEDPCRRLSYDQPPLPMQGISTIFVTQSSQSSQPSENQKRLATYAFKRNCRQKLKFSFDYGTTSSFSLQFYSICVLIINQPPFSALGQIVAQFSAVERVFDEMTCVDQWVMSLPIFRAENLSLSVYVRCSH